MFRAPVEFGHMPVSEPMHMSKRAAAVQRIEVFTGTYRRTADEKAGIVA